MAHPPENALIRLQNIKKLYRADAVETAALDDVSAELSDGTLVIRVRLPASASARQRIDIR